MRGLGERSEDERKGVQGPHDLAQSMDVALLDMTGRRLSLRQAIKVGQIVSEVVRMRDRLKARLEQFLFGVSHEIAQRSVHAQPRALGRDQRHANSGIIKGVAKMLFSLAQRLTDALLLRDMAVEFLD